MEVWFNPSCSKSRHAVAALEAAGVAHTTRRYLEQPPTAAELESLLDALGRQPWEIARTGEAVAAELGLAELPREGAAARARWIALMVEHPVLIQRPLLVAADGPAHVGRDDAGVVAAIAHERAGGG